MVELSLVQDKDEIIKNLRRANRRYMRECHKLAGIVEKQGQVIDRRYEEWNPDLEEIAKRKLDVYGVCEQVIRARESGAAPKDVLVSAVKRILWIKEVTARRLIELLADSKHTDPPLLLKLGGKLTLYALNAPPLAEEEKQE